MCTHGVHAVGRRRRACRAVCPSDEHGAMLPRLADLRAERAAWAVCKKAGGMANAGTRQAASTLASRLAPRHPRQACRPTYDSLHACVPRQLKAEPGEAAALAQPRVIGSSPARGSSWAARREAASAAGRAAGQRALAEHGSGQASSELRCPMKLEEAQRHQALGSRGLSSGRAASVVFLPRFTASVVFLHCTITEATFLRQTDSAGHR